MPAMVSVLCGVALAGAALAAPAHGWAEPVSLGEGSYPKVGVGGGEDIVVFGGGTGGLWATSRPVGGGSFAPATQVSPPGGAELPATLPQLAVSPSGHAVVAVLTGREGAVGAAVREPRGPFGPLVRLAGESFPDTALDLQVAIADGGAGAVAWADTEARRVLLARRRPGGAFGTVRPVSPKGAVTADVAMLGTRGRTLVVWARRGRIHTRVISPGGKLGRVRTASRGRTNSQPRVAGHRSSAVLVWTRRRGSASTIGVADVAGDGTARSRGRVASPDSAAPYARSPELAVAAGGGALLAFLACGSVDCYSIPGGDQGGRLFAAARTRRGPLGPARSVTGAGSHVLDADPNVTDEGRTLLSFNQGDPGTDVGGQESRHAVAVRGSLDRGLTTPRRLSRQEQVDFNGAVSSALSPSGEAIVLWSGFVPPDYFGGDVWYSTDGTEQGPS